MKKKQFDLFPLLSLPLIAVLILIINRGYPEIGHDYSYFIPRMLDNYLHQKINGLEIQWYTPSFGGGIPAYPNPQDIQYSLPDFLMFAVNPWTALMLSLAIYSLIGFTAFYYLLKDECGFGASPSALGAMFILANGFVIEHAIVGHVGFHPFPLFGLILYLIFSKKISTINSAILIGIIAAILVNQSGFYIIFIFSLSTMMFFPLIYLISPHLFKEKQVAKTAIIGVVFAILLSASKLTAVLSFMRYFPREVSEIHTNSYIQSIGGMFAQLAGGMAMIPYYALTGKNLNELELFFQQVTGTDSRIWEMDVAISPVLIVILIIGAIRAVIFFLKGKQNARPFSSSKVAAIAALIVGIWLIVDFSIAKGVLYTLLKPLPIIRSLHENVRYTAALIFPFAYLGAFILDRFNFQKYARPLFWAVGTSVILFEFSYFLPSDGIYCLIANANPDLRVYSQIEDGERFPILNIQNLKDVNVFREQASSIKNVYEVIFGYDLENFHPEVHQGSVYEINDGYFNMTNPASYVFPEENGVHLYERFRVTQKADLDLFINRIQPNFEISYLQKLANAINITALIGIGIYFLYKVFKPFTSLELLSKVPNIFISQ